MAINKKSLLGKSSSKSAKPTASKSANAPVANKMVSPRKLATAKGGLTTAKSGLTTAKSGLTTAKSSFTTAMRMY